jgi:hypothetical protein
MQLTQLTRLTQLSRGNGGFGADIGGIHQPIVLTSPLGVVFVNSSGAVLVRGTKRVTPQEP